MVSNFLGDNLLKLPYLHTILMNSKNLQLLLDYTEYELIGMWVLNRYTVHKTVQLLILINVLAIETEDSTNVLAIDDSQYCNPIDPGPAIISTSLSCIWNHVLPSKHH
jgi:hypothetical protein